jgi:hypothetical protein
VVLGWLWFALRDVFQVGCFLRLGIEWGIPSLSRSRCPPDAKAPECREVNRPGKFMSVHSETAELKNAFHSR